MMSANELIERTGRKAGGWYALYLRTSRAR